MHTFAGVLCALISSQSCGKCDLCSLPPKPHLCSLQGHFSQAATPHPPKVTDDWPQNHQTSQISEHGVSFLCDWLPGHWLILASAGPFSSAQLILRRPQGPVLGPFLLPYVVPRCSLSGPPSTKPLYAVNPGLFSPEFLIYLSKHLFGNSTRMPNSHLTPVLSKPEVRSLLSQLLSVHPSLSTRDLYL
jgi:hypothetical protein